jgi:hypothetical protein
MARQHHQRCGTCFIPLTIPTSTDSSTARFRPCFRLHGSHSQWSPHPSTPRAGLRYVRGWHQTSEAARWLLRSSGLVASAPAASSCRSTNAGRLHRVPASPCPSVANPHSPSEWGVLPSSVEVWRLPCRCLPALPMWHGVLSEVLGSCVRTTPCSHWQWCTGQGSRPWSARLKEREYHAWTTRGWQGMIAGALVFSHVIHPAMQ